MQKNTMNANETTKKRDGIASMTSYITGYTYEHCRLVRNGKRENERIEKVIMLLAERQERLKKRYHKNPKIKV